MTVIIIIIIQIIIIIINYNLLFTQYDRDFFDIPDMDQAISLSDICSGTDESIFGQGTHVH